MAYPFPARPSDARGSSGRNHFIEPAVPFNPPDIPAWTQARTNINQENRLDIKMERGYRGPDPGMFIGTSQDRRYIYLAHWLALRGAWWARQTRELDRDGTSIGASGQQWRDVLYHYAELFIGVGDKLWEAPRAAASHTKANQRLQQVHTLFAASDVVLSTLPRNLTFHEHHFETQRISQITAYQTSWILWELYENQFRLELLALDRAILKNTHWDSNRSIGQRMNRICLVSGTSSSMMLVGELPKFNGYLASENWKGRLLALRPLQSICVDWDKALGGSSGLAEPDLKTPALAVENNVNLLEKRLASFYCQTFYQHFGRPPILPHRLPLR